MEARARHANRELTIPAGGWSLDCDQEVASMEATRERLQAVQVGGQDADASTGA